jgi:hypothetical protein
MPLQLVAYAMQSRKASGLDALDELDELDVLKGLDELDDDDPVLHMLSSACRQLALSLELELDDDTPKHAPHLAMMLSTALSHLDDNVDVNFEGQPVPETTKRERTNPRSARFMSLLPTKSYSPSIQQARARHSSAMPEVSRLRDRSRIPSGIPSSGRRRAQRLVTPTMTDPSLADRSRPVHWSGTKRAPVSRFREARSCLC